MDRVKITNLWRSNLGNIYTKGSMPSQQIKQDIYNSTRSSLKEFSFASSNFKLYEEQGKIDTELRY